ncbi:MULTISPECIES: hypothetical protein [Mycobacterium]|uniref:hypothetical protein n=1 Tax=Mycobacterium TaxID=1763 RepID=UPI0012E3526B|nr:MULTISPECIES: hypothetical protein [Mycobacterium]
MVFELSVEQINRRFLFGKLVSKLSDLVVLGGQSGPQRGNDAVVAALRRNIIGRTLMAGTGR